MNQIDLSVKIEKVIPLLYQNKGQAALDEVTSVLAVFQERLKNLGPKTEEEQTFIVSAFKIILEAYQNHDVLAIADCLQEYGEKMVDICNG